ncbi:acVLRF1 family peptidyl-tRNA hydrolase [Phytomonospora sp. NPDC050363]|uniref:acVLRF1 family peptidyl-tRNA hydrolase n=1 Tax=Phytomonospora sp. NPDC050363 TaxID=3155642 RepID=UPI0033C31BBE
MSNSRPATGGGRVISVAPERVVRWLNGFIGRHGPSTVEQSLDGITLTAADGAVAACALPLGERFEEETELEDLVETFMERAETERTVAVLVVRKGAFAIGVFQGPKLLVSKVDTTYVQGRTAAGGWSQQRYARRREKQAKQALKKATDAAARVLMPHLHDIEHVVAGGDRRTVADVLADKRLEALRHKMVPLTMEVGEPRLATLKDTPRQFRAVQIHLTEPEPRDEPPETAESTQDEPGLR